MTASDFENDMFNLEEGRWSSFAENWSFTNTAIGIVTLCYIVIVKLLILHYYSVFYRNVTIIYLLFYHVAK